MITYMSMSEDRREATRKEVEEFCVKYREETYIDTGSAMESVGWSSGTTGDDNGNVVEFASVDREVPGVAELSWYTMTGDDMAWFLGVAESLLPPAYGGDPRFTSETP